MTYKADIDAEIRRKEAGRFFRGYQQKSKNPLGNCEECGRQIFNTDRTGEPYRQCYRCAGYR